MMPSLNRSRKTFSPEIEKQIRSVISRAMKFKTEADSILSKYKPPSVQEDVYQRIENLFLKFHPVVKQIEREQRHEERSTLEVQDEYDVQNLLHGLLRIHFDDIRPEEWTPSVAGAPARMDFLLKKEQIVIEVKMIRKGLGKRKLREQLIVDKEYYRRHRDCKILYCLVYDPKGKISNPKGFERDLSEKIGDFETKVFIVPRL